VPKGRRARAVAPARREAARVTVQVEGLACRQSAVRVAGSVARGAAACLRVRTLEAQVKRTQYRRPESVLVLVYTEAGEVLLLLRRTPPDFWQSVTGTLEWGEDPVSAAHRELFEETGLVAGDKLIDCGQRNQFAILPAWRDRYAPEVTSNTEHVFRVMWPGSRPEIRLNPAEHSAFLWLPRTDAWRLASSYTNRFAIERFVPAAEDDAAGASARLPGE